MNHKTRMTNAVATTVVAIVGVLILIWVISLIL